MLKELIIVSLILFAIIPTTLSDDVPFTSLMITSYADYDLLPFSHIIDKRVYENQVIVDGHLPIILTFNMESNKTLDKNKTKEFVTKEVFAKSITASAFNFSIDVLVNETYDKEIEVFKEVKVKDINGTEYTYEVLDKLTIIKDYRWVWKSLDSLETLKIPKNGAIVIDIYGQTLASINSWSMDVVPTINLEGKSYTLSQYAWWNASWGYSKKIVIDHTKVVNNLYNYPILYTNKSADFTAHALATGYDFRFVNFDNTTRFHYEIEYYDSAVGNLTAWVNVTNISSQSDTKLWVYYGNAAANTRPIDERYTWDSNYLFVTHMNDSTTSKIFDSTRNTQFTGTKTDGANQPQVELGKFAMCQNFSDDAVQFASGTDINVGTNDYTCEQWLRPHSVAALAQTFFRYQDGTHKFYWYMFGGVNNYEYMTWVAVVTEAMASTNFIVNNWYYMAYVGDRDVGNYIYQNGRSDALTTDNKDNNANNEQLNIVFKWGRNAPATSQYYGRADEIRFSKNARNASWINTTWMCLYYPNAFLTTGDENVLPVSMHWYEPPTISYMYPLNESVGICPCDDCYVFTVGQRNASNVNVSIYLSLYPHKGFFRITAGCFQNITNGTYTFCISDYDPLHIVRHLHSQAKVVMLNTWYNITWDQTIENEGFEEKSLRYTEILYPGSYSIIFWAAVQDASPVVTGHEMAIGVWDGSDMIEGSYREMTFSTKAADVPLTSIIHQDFGYGSNISFRYIGDDADQSLHTNGTWSHDNICAYAEIFKEDSLISEFNTTYYWYIESSLFNDSTTNSTSGIFWYKTAENKSNCTTTGGGGGAYGNIYPATGVIGFIGVIGLIGILGYLKKKKRL